MLLKEISNILENWSPLNSAEEFDNVGLLVGKSDEIGYFPANCVDKVTI